ncbi:MAG TPA: ABC transporter permease subunit [Parvularculaceae bacterium]|nr:ABC transporter permease subunit [Parvularculaceae bacterium]
MLANIAAIARAEFLIGLRNRWATLAALVLFVFSGVLGLVGGAPGGAEHINRLTLSVASLSVLSVYLTPLLALLLGFDAIAGEVDRGALPLLLATPVSRLGVIAGKFCGHFAALAIALSVGFGAPALVIRALTAGGDFIDVARLILTSILLGAVFLAVGYIVSALARTSAFAAGLAIGAWLLLVVLYDLALLGALVVDKGGVFSREVFPWLLIANPADAFRLFNLSALDLGSFGVGLSGAGAALPYPASFALLSLAAWIIAALGGAFLAFRRVRP